MKNKINYTILTLILIVSSLSELKAQILPLVAKEQETPILLVGGTIHTGDGQVLKNTAVGFDKGTITFLGKPSDLGTSVSDYKVIDITGQQVYPGFILLNSVIGINEINAVPHTKDTVEEGEYLPNLKSVYAFDMTSTFIPPLRFNGILYLESIRSNGIIPGTSSVMSLDGWNWEDAVFKRAAAIHIDWPSSLSSYFDAATNSRLLRPNVSYETITGELQKLFSDAKQYGQLATAQTNLKLEALEDLFQGKRVLVIHANEPKEIIESITFAKSFDIDHISLVASQGTLEVVDFLKENHVPVIVPPTYNLPRNDDMDYDAFYGLPTQLQRRGIEVSMYHVGSLSNSINLPFYAGTAIAFGMDKEEALKTISLNPAKILGIDDKLGSIAVGKVASLFVSKGDALDVQTNALTMAFIRGKHIDLEGPQQLDYKRYSAKFEQNK
ncbi:amidohydrolase family protein [Allomuricauda sp. F6463D]|uniref:amidohydrolase family protein n=1 Tax=Allomuricauda sp. F6463D TaxID=2926409 RepID=UPI001FF61F65|nr:amidohydrolase family protein [Muricauda sp. F6463D]MCK0159115.1 amidohydrolase family protein [Muricauda sp. F6463D]